MEKTFLFDFISNEEINNIQNYEIVIFINDVKFINEDFLVPKIEDLINTVIKKDIEAQNIKYLISDLNTFQDKTKHKISSEDYFIFIKSINDMIYLPSN